MILVTVQFDNIDALFIRRPADIGKVTVCRVSGLQINCFSALNMIYSYGYLMAGHSCHRIFVRFKGCNAGSGINLRISSYHALIHAIESQTVSSRAPECTFIYSEFVAVNSLSVYDIHRICFLFVRIDLQILFSFMCDAKIASHGIGYVAILLAEVQIGSFFVQTEQVADLFLTEIIPYHIVSLTECNYFLVFPGQRSSHQCTELFQFLSWLKRFFSIEKCFVYFIKCYQYSFFSIADIDGYDVLYICTYTNVSPPLQSRYIFRNQVEVIVSSRNDIFQGIGFLFLCEASCCCHTE